MPRDENGIAVFGRGKAGKDNFGFPYCHLGNIPDQEFGWGRSCDEFTKPVARSGPHSAPLGMRFYTGSMLYKWTPPQLANRTNRKEYSPM